MDFVSGVAAEQHLCNHTTYPGRFAGVAGKGSFVQESAETSTTAGNPGSVLARALVSAAQGLRLDRLFGLPSLTEDHPYGRGGHRWGWIGRS